MIPSLVVYDIRDALVEFLATTFALADDEVRDELTRFLTHENDGIFRGPYLGVRTPFKAVEVNWRSPLDWMPDEFQPYLHQATAFERLSTAGGRTPQPTLVTTGTGSGKTECFLFPVLDHCARERAEGKAGIKALLLYPMNALASDQAGRLAELLHRDARLAGVKAGLYVGDHGRYSAMQPDALIDRREVLRADPPDILLTNYKMLDFLLLRREDRNLWAANKADTLRYVVLDEFHTYDGAQGTDVAMLLRRLGRALGMNKLGQPLGVATPVATSATLGSGVDTVEVLCEFASKVFGCRIGPEAVIGETRQTVEEACANLDYLLPIPDVDELAQVGDDIDAIAAAFCRREQLDGEPPDVVDLTDVVTLGDRLLAHPLTRAVLAAVGERTRSWPDALADINTRASHWGRASLRNTTAVEHALSRYLWLLSLARRQQGTRALPLFAVDVQLWIREVSRLLRAVDTTPSFRWLDSAAIRNDEEPGAGTHELPAIYCRSCGLSGWMAVKSELGDTLLTSPATVYQQSLNRSPTVRALIQASPDDPEAFWYDPASRRLLGNTDDGAVPVFATADEDDAKANRCPACRERDTIRFLGLQVASLASVAVNTLFGSPHLDVHERKLLAFTDSVQDASHRAAFFAGRTHRFNLRARMSSIVAEHGDMSLHDLGDELLAAATSDRDRFALVPPDLIRHPKVRTVWTDRPHEGGLDILRSRVGFEVDLEFGLRARVGRTLELSRAAVAAVQLDDFDDCANLVAEHLRQLDPLATEEMILRVDTYLRGLLERMRVRGGLHHSLLDPYIADSGRLWFAWGGRPDGLPPFRPGQSRPLFPTLAAKGEFDSVIAASSTPTWYVDWAQRSLGIDDPTFARDLNRDVFGLLSRPMDAILELQSSSGTVWALRRRNVRVWDVVDDDPDEPTVAGLRCDTCGSRHPVPPPLLDNWWGTPCLRYRCIGSYRHDEPRVTNYYRALYRSGDIRRVVAREHTGLLDRRSREDLEKAFKSGTAPDAPNVIAATPTLEMGIDIGDLSAVMLTSVPRNPASYIQRVGRAGRKSGNSLITTFVRTDTHGLYYLAEPEAMIAGQVRPPNCYLDATETLRRQYVAYLLDRMADLTIEADPLPNQVGALMRSGLDEGAILRRLVDASMLDRAHVDAFLDLFADQLHPATADHLREFASTGIEATVKNAVERWRDYERDLGLRRTRLTNAIDKLLERSHRSTDDDTQLGSLQGQRAAVIDLLRRHRDEYTLSALERLGLLPNYLLLGDVTTLSATLWAKDENGHYENETVDYQRSARLALTEFAPGNSFYVRGHRHRIDAVEMGTADEPLYETWRLCPECGYGAIELQGQPPTMCARCGSHGIADNGARHTVLRLRTALSLASEESARVYDDTDERQREYYDVVTAIDADPAHISEAWRLKERAFGAELSSVTHLRTFNLGFADRRGDRVLIAGRDAHATRFTVCRHCGAVADVRDDRGGTRPERLHHGWCKVRSGAVNPQWDKIILVHELTTEAVRLLLPISMFEVDERMASFTGALLLGLRHDFGGNPDHLEIARADLPNRGGQGRRRFLVVYDSVPGGTGYLARLAEPDKVRQLLEAAREIISMCPCRTEGRQACHRCLLGVVDRRDYEYARRDIALDILDDLLSAWQYEPITSISGIDIGKVEESELERRFKTAIRQWAQHPDNPNVTYTQAPGENGRDAFELHITEEGQSTRYLVREQEGVSTTPSTLPDFLIKRQDEHAPEIAIYLDGFQFHASPDVNNIADDAAKRAGVRESGRLVWNLTWDDVADFHKAVDRETLGRAPSRSLLSGEARHRALAVHNAKSGKIEFDTVSRNAVEQLLTYIRRPAVDQWERLALSAVAGAFADCSNRGALRADEIAPTIAAGVRLSPPPPGSAAAEPRALSARWASIREHQLTLVLDVRDPNAERWTVVSALADDASTVSTDTHRGRWRDWLQWANLLQFLRSPGRDAVMCATSQADLVPVDNLWILDGVATAGTEASPAPSPEPVAVTSLTDGQEDELSLILVDEIAQLVRQVLLAGAPDFVSGAELDGESLEASWPDQRVGIARDGQQVNLDGWDIRPVARWTVQTLVESLKERS
jgi:hypothetical protein